MKLETIQDLIKQELVNEGIVEEITFTEFHGRKAIKIEDIIISLPMSLINECQSAFDHETRMLAVKDTATQIFKAYNQTLSRRT